MKNGAADYGCDGGAKGWENVVGKEDEDHVLVRDVYDGEGDAGNSVEDEAKVEHHGVVSRGWFEKDRGGRGAANVENTDAENGRADGASRGEEEAGV